MRLFHRSPSGPSRAFEWLYTACCTWFITGLFLDGWAHNHVPGLETFFTPWHAVFYSGYLFLAVTLIALRLQTGKQHMPAGYREAFVGVGIFFAGGIGDMLWHEAFGVEKDIEALFSPTHLVLALGAILMLAAPWLSSVRTGKADTTIVRQLPAILALTYAASTVMFLTQFHHWSDLRLVGVLPTRQTAELRQAVAMAGYLWHLAVLMAAAILLLRTSKPTLGALTALFTISTAGMALMRMDTPTAAFPIICIGYITGFFADLWAARIWPIEKNLAGFRWFTAVVPAMLVALLHAYALSLHDTWWSIHMWTGAVAIAAGTGALLGVAIVAPSRK